MEKLLLILVFSIQSSSYSLGGDVLSPLHANHMSNARSPLPIGQRVDGFLRMDKPSRFYFVANGSHDILTLRVTPCESPLFWTLSGVHNKRAHGAGGVNKGHLRPHNQPLHTRTLFSFQGNGEETFTTGVTSDSLYFLDIASLESDTSFQVFVWDHKNQGNLWPQLPNDSQLEITSAEEDRIKLSWKPSLGDGKKINYCVFVNKQHNVKTLCATESNINKMFSNQLKENEGKSSKSLDPAMKTSKKNSNNLKENVMEQKINHDQLSSKNFVGAQKVCVGHWTNATISKLKPKTLYYFDVFAVNSHTGTSLAYTGTFAETKNKHRSQLATLPNDEMVNIFLKSKVLRMMTVDLPAHGDKWLFIHSCLHKVHLQVTVNGKVIISQNIHRAHNFKISGKPKTSCIITLKSSKGGPGLVKILATTAHNHLPFPNLSSDIGFSVHNSTCSSATVTWTGSGHGTKYCIYARHLEQNLDLKLIHKHQNSCLSTNSRSKAERVFCKHAGPHSPRVEKIKDLKPGKTYLLDLYFIGLHNSTIKFPSRVVRTQGWCS
ncbi:hypothetical protein XENTR_v10007964 [Xenopus tropicalis]|uniref:Protein NDNF n=1 Tax=Xenopus tropicalis TaxID=8364 RepID=F6UG11_XENTR|nr:protein NDNF-like [Xenopus tropicalis]KAE8614065.1 hypothetical protein XENTR_v10007964 [Xenopus tropicalis]|eukprot:XP_002937304.1 PREDICTED: protein NDNF-like [Xenopus tropicalis]